MCTRIEYYFLYTVFGNDGEMSVAVTVELCICKEKDEGEVLLRLSIGFHNVSGEITSLIFKHPWRSLKD